jgi:hypothetical protein
LIIALPTESSPSPPQPGPQGELFYHQKIIEELHLALENEINDMTSSQLSDDEFDDVTDIITGLWCMQTIQVGLGINSNTISMFITIFYFICSLEI